MFSGDPPGGCLKTTEPGTSISGMRAGIRGGIGDALGDRDVAGGLDEAAEGGVGDRVRSIQKPATVTGWAGASSG